MPLLFFVSLLWAFSFGLIKHLTGGFDGAFISAARLGLALLVFLPFLRLRGLGAKTTLTLAGIGAVQFGLMYLAYNESFRFLKSHEVALFTLTTPILVTLLADAFERTLRGRALAAALLAVAGAAVIVVKKTPTADTLLGVALVQLSNLAFALGQVLYRRLRSRPQHAALRDRDVFGLLYAGALVLTLPVCLVRSNFSALSFTPTNLGILLYLGVVASGLGFFLWNKGATRVGSGTLAAMNNAKIPLAVAVSLLVFGEQADLPRLLVGGAVLLGAVWLAERNTA
ncbi:MAG TPA: EamA family transporter [Opitutaceae bacterium]|nr:EamA family transporter [Opitutaceae bacterium]